MKKIAITGRLELNKSYYELRECLDTNWALLFQKMNMLPIFLPLEIDVDTYLSELDIDGILLTGGNDLNNLSESLLSKKRDAHEFKIIESAIKNRIPLFGACRGMQVIAHYFNCSFKAVKGHVAIEHSLQVNKDSKHLLQLQALQKVNAYHNYAVSEVSDKILVSATDEKGVIKAIEHKELPIFGQMWHPERSHPFSIAEMNLISSFFESNSFLS